jgi:hypothetical protein
VKKRGTPLAGPTVSRKRPRASTGHISLQEAGLAEDVMVLPGFGSLDLLKRMRVQEKHVCMASIPNSDNPEDKTRLNGYSPGKVLKDFADEMRVLAHLPPFRVHAAIWPLSPPPLADTQKSAETPCPPLK